MPVPPSPLRVFLSQLQPNSIQLDAASSALDQPALVIDGANGDGPDFAMPKAIDRIGGQSPIGATVSSLG
jgi:hypothetical protein